MRKRIFQRCGINNKVRYTLLMCLAFLLNATMLSAQTQKITVNGTVVDTAGEPLIGASVVEKGTSNGTITDFDGNFSLNVSPQGRLSATYMGYITQEIPVNNKTSIKVILKEDSKILDEVVVVGFGSQKKVNLTGSVGIATAKDLESRPVQNAVAALQGVVPGLNIATSGTGTLDAEKSINIRGTTTIGDGSSGSPLVLIDGMEDNLNRINPQDIESISVLKDAAASAIYGSRAPFGVILVTTKSGSEGKTTINYNNSFRYSKPINMPDMMNSWEFINFYNDAFMNNNGSQYSYFTSQVASGEYAGLYYSDMVKKYIDGELDPLNTIQAKADGSWNYDYCYGNVDWLDEYYKDWSSSQEHNISISGGNKSVNYYLSANYMDQGGLLASDNDNYERYAITGKINAKVNDYIAVNFTTRFTRNNYERPIDFNDGFFENVIRRGRPMRPVYDTNGNPMNDLNYLDVLENGGETTNEKDIFVNQFKITITPLKNWNIIGELNTRINSNWDKSVTKIVTGLKADGVTTYSPMLGHKTSSVSEYSYKSVYLNPSVYTNYNITLADKHNLGATAGFQYEQFDEKSVSAYRKNLLSDDLPVLDLTTTDDISELSLGGSVGEWRTAGFFGRINYDYEGKYLLELNGRYDGTSRFRSGSRWVFNPSFSLGWNVAREEFFEPLTEYVSVLKPRFSYGQLANQNTTNWYPTYVTMAVKNKPGSDDNPAWLVDGQIPSVAYVPGMVSTSLTWEKIQTTNIGLDFGFFNHRLSGSYDYYVRKSLNMVGAGVDLPATLGTGVPKTNNLDLKTYGWELQLSWKDRINDFSYGVTFNLSDNQTKVTKYPNENNSLSSYRVGEVTGNIYGYTTIGIAKTQEEMDAHLEKVDQSALGSNWGAGDIMYADIDGDGKVNNGENLRENKGDLKVIGNSSARYRTGITVNMAWKGIDFQMFWQGVLKRDWYPTPGGRNNILFWGITSAGEWGSTGLKEHLDYFRADEDNVLGQNLDSYYARPIMGGNTVKNQKTQTRYLQDASYMRLKNIQLGYTLPKIWTQKVGMSNVRVFVSGENLLTLTNLKGIMDPESVGIGKDEGVTYPNSATYSFGINVSF